jgi:hypothetical protein
MNVPSVPADGDPDATPPASTHPAPVLPGRRRPREFVTRERKSIWDFGIVGTNRNADNRLSSIYGTLAQAKAAYPTVTDLTLDDQIDWAGTQAAWHWMNKHRLPISLEGAQLNINRAVVSRGYMNVDGGNATIGMRLMAKKRIDDGSAPAPDLSYPTNSRIGPLDGCAIFVAEPAYYMVVANIDFYDGRFGICYLNDPNSPVHRNLRFNHMNAGVFYYLGCQNARYYNCGGAPLGVLHISSATAFPSGHPNIDNDNYYSDNCTFTNEWGFNSFGIEVHAAFDRWFRDSIFRPTVVSRVQGSASTYNDAEGRAYPIDSPCCLPTGRLIYMPYRNLRICFSLIIKGQDSRGPGMTRGYAYVGTEVKSLTLEGNQYEQLFESLAPDDTSAALMTVGSITSGSIAEQAQLSYIDLMHPFVAYTGRGRNEGFADDRGLFNLGAQPNLVKDRVGIRGYRQGRSYEGEKVLPTVLNVYREQSRTDAHAPLDAYYRVDGTTFSNFEVSTLVESLPVTLYLPQVSTDGKTRVMSLLRTHEPFSGFLEIMVRNCTTGETDCARYQVTTGASEQLTLAATVRNGDTVVQFTNPPEDEGRTMRYALWSPRADGCGKGFTTDLYLGDNRIRVLNRVSGLPAPLAAGSVVHRKRACTPVQEFQRGWITVVSVDSPGGGIAYQDDDVLAIRNHLGDNQNPDKTDALEIVIRTSHLASPHDRRYLAVAPTTGTHMEGEEVHRLRGSSTPVRRWRCKSSGTGDGLFFAVEFDTLSGNTQARPKLTSNDGGVLFYDTTLSKLIRWSGAAWQV